MPAMEPLCHLVGVKLPQLSKEENILLEMELFMRICEELKRIFSEPYKEYFHWVKFTEEKENIMLETHLIRFIIKDILATKQYTLEGIAYYANVHKDIVYEAAAGCNKSPSATLLRSMIELHREVRRDLYQAIIKKVLQNT